MDLIIFLSVLLFWTLIGYIIYKAGKHRDANDKIYQDYLNRNKN